MKRFAKYLIIFLLCLTVFIAVSTSTVKRSSFFNENYYKETIALIDSARSVAKIQHDSVEAGFAKVSITPVLDSSEDNYMEGRFVEVPLAGYGARKGASSTGIHDSIFVKAVALKISGRTIVFAGADLLIMPPNIIDSVAKNLAGKGINREQLFLSATHTHSSLGGWGPGFIGKQFAGNENKNIEKWLVLQISRAVTDAINDIKPALIGSGLFNAVNFTNNRTTGEAGTKNNDFSYFVIDQIGHRKAIIGSFSAHSTTLGSDNMQISADYPGYWARRLEESYADIALFFAGATGSQSPRTSGNGFEKPEYIGEALADSLIIHSRSVEMYDKTTFSSVSLKIHLPEYHIRLTTKVNLSSFWSNRLMPVPENVYLQAVRIGDMLWITTPSDFSGEYALQIKNSLAAEGFKSNVSSFNGSYVGYIVPGRYFYVDDYESKLMGWFGPEMGDYTMEIIRQISRIVTGRDNI